MEVTEEGVTIENYGDKISKELTVFYNPAMKINRDISLLFINSFFEKEIKFCDPMAATGIRELRFIDKINNKFSKLTIGDISKTAIENIKKNFEKNNLPLEKIDLINENAINTISKYYYDFIEVDPFGSPVPFLDIAFQRVKHNGVVSVTATDTAALCGTYPRTTIRRYGIKVEKTLYHEELGLRNLIAYCIREGAKYDKVVEPLISFTNNHFYKVFFNVKESRTEATKKVRELKYLKWDRVSQENTLSQYEEEGFLGKTYIGNLNNKILLNNMIENLNLIEDNKQITKLLNSLNEELDVFGYINPHKLEKEYKFTSKIKFEELKEELIKKEFKFSRVHNNPVGIKTDAPTKTILEIMKKY